MKLDLDRVSRKIGPVVRLMNTAALDNLFAKSKITWRRAEPKSRSGWRRTCIPSKLLTPPAWRSLWHRS